LPQPGSNRGYRPEQLIEQMIVSIWCGACRFAYGGASIVQTLITNARFAANTSGAGFLPNPVVVTLVATSRVDSRQEAQINVVLTN
jgi:hypothetical protein